MISKVKSSAVLGIEAYLVDVEIDLAQGLPSFNLVGLPDAAVKESRERVRAAIKNTGFQFPVKRITVNLAPADIKKEGAAYDLPIAIGILAAQGLIDSQDLDDYLVVGELSLTGDLRRINGALPMAIQAKTEGKKGMILPAINASEAAVVEGIEIIPVNSLLETVDFLNTRMLENAVEVDYKLNLTSDYKVDFAEVKGQQAAKRALEIAAAGGHNVIMIGPPGSGKTMLSRRLPTILPDLSLDEAVELTKIYSILGLLPTDEPLITTRPFRSPHHTTSNAGMIGGGRIPQPGEVSLAHYGVLFLDELPEFNRNVLEVLRQPLEEREVTISRSLTTLTYPANIMLIAAMNPCPCGFHGDSKQNCSCSHYEVERYLNKVSGPLLDRIDIHIEVPRLEAEVISSSPDGESSAQIRARVNKARQIQYKRFKDEEINCNSEMNGRLLEEYCELTIEGKELLKTAIKRLNLSARAYDRILKLSRTIADLAGANKIQEEYIAEAVQYRDLDRKFFAN
ncbi:YifB family Mg chelatase-like AAA ATPase [Selenihalanaerobacter shriftii]|uniref:Magnesium chelatase family protein n=1 Tax=Selenihalanaerobacter shriftii TaxID=142842 RepID=A0A1T4MA76_9FIRM|nr:YifB family Mg chelatase-like AAA ATPase [Selenihalanaerobacter shriftii]SJZ63766.1 magnesium chelatase family protein [Selenihalanaerobacter shriftii]